MPKQSKRTTVVEAGRPGTARECRSPRKASNVDAISPSRVEGSASNDVFYEDPGILLDFIRHRSQIPAPHITACPEEARVNERPVEGAAKNDLSASPHPRNDAADIPDIEPAGHLEEMVLVLEKIQLGQCVIDHGSFSGSLTALDDSARKRSAEKYRRMGLRPASSAGRETLEILAAVLDQDYPGRLERTGQPVRKGVDVVSAANTLVSDRHIHSCMGPDRASEEEPEQLPLLSARV